MSHSTGNADPAGRLVTRLVSSGTGLHPLSTERPQLPPNRHSGVVLGASQQVGPSVHSATAVSQNVSQDPAIGFDGFGAENATGTVGYRADTQR